MHELQVQWAATHTWFAGTRTMMDGKNAVIVRDAYQREQTFSRFSALKAWAK